jgi:hypothetical protein
MDTIHFLKRNTLMYSIGLLALSVVLVQCSDSNGVDAPTEVALTSSSSATEQMTASGSSSSEAGAVYEVLPVPAVMNPNMSPTPFSDNISSTPGSYSVNVNDASENDSPSSGDEVTSIEIRFSGSNGTKYLIDNVNVIHKEEGSGDHPFFGGVGLNKTMHGDTGIGTNLMPKMLSYITFWGITDLKNAETGEVIAQDRLIHFMTATRVRDENLMMIASA